jgi:Protein of unknown function (DUF2892)
MSIDSAVFRFAGFVVIAASLLAIFVDKNFAWLGVFAGANMLQASFTKFCPAAMVFKKLGCKDGAHFK